MRIAFVSYEIPPATGGGGIGTYIANVLPMLAERGHSVTAFAGAGQAAEGVFAEHGVNVHRFGKTVADFLKRLPIAFEDEHRRTPFDAVESPEYHAQGADLLALTPRPAMIVKLHTPEVLLRKHNRVGSRLSRIRMFLGAIKRAQVPSFRSSQPRYTRENDPERRFTDRADLVIGPCHSIVNELDAIWSLPMDRVSVVPYPFQPMPALLDIPINRTFRRVTFIGRIEARKGVLELARAIPRILAMTPDVHFRFVGRPHPAPNKRGTMTDYIIRKLGRWAKHVEFTGGVPYDELPRYFSETDICVFPSRWENFPNVCLEAMSAGCGVVGSREGGMVEQLDHGKCGVLINPRSPESIAQGILTLLQDPQRRMNLASAARERILTEYSFERLGPIYEGYFQRAIDNAHEKKAASLA